MKWFRWRPLIALAVVAQATLAAGQAARGPPPAPVVVAVAERRSLAPLSWYPGTVISRNHARIPAEVEGRIEWVAEIGERVKRGETVARLDDTLLGQRRIEDQAAIAREQARLKYLNAEVRRLSVLVKRNNVSRSRLDEAISNRDVTRGELQADRARLGSTRERLARTVIRAPFNGVVTERMLQLGEWAERGKAVVRLVDSEALEVQVWVPVSALHYLQRESRLKLLAGAKQASGTVRTIVPVGDERSRLYELRVALQPNGWPVGQTLRVAVPTAPARDVIAVPRDALVLRRGGASIYRIGAQGLAEKVEVKIGIAAGGMIEVSGIHAGDRVAVRGGERLRPGQAVEIVDTLAP